MKLILSDLLWLVPAVGMTLRWGSGPTQAPAPGTAERFLMKLTLRDLFWLVLVVAMGCAWAIDHWQLTTWQNPYVVMLEKCNSDCNSLLSSLELAVSEEGYEIDWTDNNPMLKKIASPQQP